VGTEFSSLSTALSALQSERKALEVTGQNIANANSAGYTRQRANMQALGGSVIPAMYSKSDGIGNGVAVSAVQRLQDSFLEQRANTENGAFANLQGRESTLSDIENSFGEPGSTGIQASLSTYWNGWDNVANNPADLAGRTALIGAGQSLAAGLNQAASAMSSQWTSSRETLVSTVQQVNVTTANIAALNKAIVAATAAGNQPNDLMDQRDTLIRQLATSIGVTTKANANGSTDVLLGGSSLVNGSTSRGLAVGGATALDQVGGAPPTPVTVTWTDTGTAPAVGSGQAGATLTALNMTLPSYSAKLDAVAAALVSGVNGQQAAGYDLSGSAGAAFFDPTKTTAASITVVMTDPKTIAASSKAPTVDGSGNTVVSLDGGNAQKLANFSGTGADAAYRQLIVGLGSETQAAQQKSDTQQSVVKQVTAARDSAAGVDLDEEQTNLVTFQQAYNAAAEYTSVLNSMLNTLINKMLV
jgi:flagellar hook-associated protein 1 FlgK